MADKKISELTAGGALQDTDLLPIARSGSTLSVLWSTIKGVFVPTTRSINTGTGLQGGGDLSADRTLSMVNVGPGVTGPIGDATHAPIITINAQGQVTALSSVVITGSAQSLDVVLASRGPDGLWKMNESSGTVAHDSSGNGWDASVASAVVSAVAPTWAQAAGPPARQSANFTSGTPGASVANASFPALSGDFTAAIWANRSSSPSGPHPDKFLMGQGSSLVTRHAGWTLYIEASNAGAGNRLTLAIGDTSAGPHVFESDNALTDDAWHMCGITKISGVWRMYVDGVLQSTTSSAAYSSTTGLWFGVDTNSTSNGVNGLMQYGMVWGARGLSGADMATIAAAVG